MRSTVRSMSSLCNMKSNQRVRTMYSDSGILPVLLRFSAKQYVAECRDLSISLTIG